MALSFAFRERLDEMELTRNQRLVLLQVEKELQASKSQILASKLANIRSMEHRCLMLDHKIASQNLKISILKSEIKDSDAKYQTIARQLRDLKSEIEELEGMEREKEKFYESKRFEMSEFRRNVEEFKSENRTQVENLRNRSIEMEDSASGSIAAPTPISSSVEPINPSVSYVGIDSFSCDQDR